MSTNVPAMTALRPSQLVAEYEAKRAAIPDALASFQRSALALKMAGTIGGTYGQVTIDTGRVDERDLEKSLLCSAWLHLYEVANIETFAPAGDKKKFHQSMADPAPFTMDNIRERFGLYVADPRGSVLRGLAEVFCELDQSFKSHDKVKIGVKGLPKRVILPSVGGYGSWGRERLKNVLNAIAVYRGMPLIDHDDIDALMKDENALMAERQVEKKDYQTGEIVITIRPARGVRLRRFENGNGHLFFSPETLADVNRALAEYYGDVLPDAHGEKPQGRQASTAVSKDLQYYPTPEAVIQRILHNIYHLEGVSILEPSCGCGRILDALRDRGAKCYGIEYHAGRAQQARDKGHAVLTANFLDTIPEPRFSRVIMNPPFYGRHYQQHIQHALKWLVPGGTLTSILPITARTDHEFLTPQWMEQHDVVVPRYNDPWSDLPVGSFVESGTRINTTVLTLSKVQ